MGNRSDTFLVGQSIYIMGDCSYVLFMVLCSLLDMQVQFCSIMATGKNRIVEEEGTLQNHH